MELRYRYNRLRIQRALYVMIIPGLVLTLIYHYGPLFGLAIAFQRYDFARSIFDQKWVGFANFTYMFHYPHFWRVVWNTLFISSMKYVLGLLAPIVVSILLNEMRHVGMKRVMQTSIYLPHFISWVLVSGIFIDVLSPGSGVVNHIIKAFGLKPVYFLGEPAIFPYVLVVTDIWKNFGFGTIIYLAALTSVDPNLYEAADIDGARRFQKIMHISIPGILPIVVLISILNLGHILNAGFEQVFNMYNPAVYSTGDIIDTLVFRLGIRDFQYDLATATGLFKSGVSLVLVSTSYYVAYRFAGYRIF
jgi:putative aldouronate transport system permease protein